MNIRQRMHRALDVALDGIEMKHATDGGPGSGPRPGSGPNSGKPNAARNERALERLRELKAQGKHPMGGPRGVTIGSEYYPPGPRSRHRTGITAYPKHATDGTKKPGKTVASAVSHPSITKFLQQAAAKKRRKAA